MQADALPAAKARLSGPAARISGATGYARGIAARLYERLRPPPEPVAVRVPKGGLPSAPEIALFRDIQVIPPVQPRIFVPGGPRLGLGDRQGMCCGPIWPEFESQTWVRHNLEGRPVDLEPQAVARPANVLSRPSVWAGYLHFHFGHLVAEHAPRLLWSRYLRPDDLHLVAIRPGTTRIPRHVQEVLAWHGLGRRHLMVVTAPTLVRELRVVPQAEQFFGHGPDAAYLDLLDHHVRQSGLVPIRSDILYVTRQGLLPRGHGGHVGEGYLVRRLAERGVSILDPSTALLREQLARYAGARTIVFADGSAIHGRQMLGRIDQRIVVLARRAQARTAEPSIAPRCTDLAYVEATRAAAVPVRPDRRGMHAESVCFYDLDAVLAGLRDVGVDLSSGWNSNDYRASCEADVAAWTDHVRSNPAKYAVDASVAALAAIMSASTAQATDPEGVPARSLLS